MDHLFCVAFIDVLSLQLLQFLDEEDGGPSNDGDNHW